jgi:hypothetical protein
VAIFNILVYHAGNDIETMAIQYLKRSDVVRVLKILPNDKAPGIDGLIHELWNTLHARFENSKESENKTMDIARVLTVVYNDIEMYGVHPETQFAAGWMSLLHKKNDKRNVGNYRPITLLNTDYKIFTKALAIKLAETVPSIIHRDQAGFTPGRSIFDQVKLIEAIIDHAKHEAEGGVVVALDQEKAYDKILHGYLWKTMEKANFPNHFVKTIKSLYENAYTSCLFNLARIRGYRMEAFEYRLSHNTPLFERNAVACHFLRC